MRNAINRDNYERRKAEAEQKAATRRLNEAIDAAEAPDATDEEFEEQPQGKTPSASVKQRKRQQQQEAEEWLQNHPEFLEDIDA